MKAVLLISALIFGSVSAQAGFSIQNASYNSETKQLEITFLHSGCQKDPIFTFNVLLCQLSTPKTCVGQLFATPSDSAECNTFSAPITQSFSKDSFDPENSLVGGDNLVIWGSDETAKAVEIQ